MHLVHFHGFIAFLKLVFENEENYVVENVVPDSMYLLIYKPVCF